jgi:hypothetical protein
VLADPHVREAYLGEHDEPAMQQMRARSGTEATA